MKKLLLILFLMFAGSVAAQESELEGLKLFPNPVTEGKINIETNDKVSVKSISIFDVFGAPQLQQQIKNTELDVHNLDKGVYIIRIQQNNKYATRKLVVK